MLDFLRYRELMYPLGISSVMGNMSFVSCSDSSFTPALYFAIERLMSVLVHIYDSLLIIQRTA